MNRLLETRRAPRGRLGLLLLVAALACASGCFWLRWGLGRELGGGPGAADHAERSTRFLGEADAGLFFEVWAQGYAPAGLGASEGVWLQPEREEVLLWERSGALRPLRREGAWLVAVAPGADRLFWVEAAGADAGLGRAALVVEALGRGELFRGPLPRGAKEEAAQEAFGLEEPPTVRVSEDGTVAACEGWLLHVDAGQWTEVGVAVQWLAGHEGSALVFGEDAEGAARLVQVERPGARPRVLDLEALSVWFQDGRHVALDLGDGAAAVDVRTGQVLARRDFAGNEGVPSSDGPGPSFPQGFTVREDAQDGGTGRVCTVARWTLPRLQRTDLLTRPCESAAEFSASATSPGQGLSEVTWTEDHHDRARALVRPGLPGKPPEEERGGGRTACLPEACVTVDDEGTLFARDPARLAPMSLPKELPATWVGSADGHPLREGLLLHSRECGAAWVWRKGEAPRTVALLEGAERCWAAPDAGTPPGR